MDNVKNRSDNRAERLRWATCVLSFISFIFASVTAGSCTHEVRDGYYDYGWGFFCSNGNEDDEPPSTDAGRASIVLAPLVGGGAMIAVWATKFFLKHKSKPSRVVWTTCRYCFAFAAISDLGTFIGLVSNIGYNLGPGGHLLWFATILWIVTTILCFLAPHPANQIAPVSSGKTLEPTPTEGSQLPPKKVITTTNPDGHMTIRTELLNSDGTLSIVIREEDTGNPTGGDMTITTIETTNPDGSITVVEEVRGAPAPIQEETNYTQSIPSRPLDVPAVPVPCETAAPPVGEVYKDDPRAFH